MKIDYTKLRKAWYDSTPISGYRDGNTIGPACRGRHRGQTALILKNLGPLPDEGRSHSFLDSFHVRWPDGEEEIVKHDVFLS